jgi:hypothetical protein
MGQYMAVQDNWTLHSCGCMPTNGTTITGEQIQVLVFNAFCTLRRTKAGSIM